MKKSKKALIISVSAVLLLIVITIASFFGTGNQIISGMYIRSEYGTSVIVNDEGRTIVLENHDKDKFSDYNQGDIITVVCSKEEVLTGGIYGTEVKPYFSFRTEKGSADNIHDYFREAGKNVITGQFLRTKNGDPMLIDEHGGAIQLCDYKDYYVSYGEYGDGDKIMVLCSEIREIYPAQAGVYFCHRLEEGEHSDLPESTLEGLRELGWIE